MDEFEAICEHASTVILIEEEPERVTRLAKPIVNELWERVKRETKDGNDELHLKVFLTSFLTLMTRCIKISPIMNDIPYAVHEISKHIEMELNEYKNETSGRNKDR